jgi:hypothetical protein
MQIEYEAPTTRPLRAHALRNKTVSVDEKSIDGSLEVLISSTARREWPELAQRADAERWSHREFLAALLKAERAQRRGSRLARGSWLAFAMGR